MKCLSCTLLGCNMRLIVKTIRYYWLVTITIACKLKKIFSCYFILTIVLVINNNLVKFGCFECNYLL